MPEYSPIVFNILIEHMEAIRAEEQSRLIQAISAPHMKKGRYRSLMRGLQKLATKVLRAALPSYEYEVIEEDPEKAAEWLAGQGVRITNKKDG